MATRDEIVRELETQVRGVARTVANDWPGVVDEDDVEQEIWLRIFESSPEYIETLYSMDKTARGTVLKKIALQYALDEREDYYEFSGNFRYSREDVDHYLKSGALYLDIGESQSLGPGEFYDPDLGDQGPKNPSVGADTDMVIQWLDLRDAMDRLYKKNSEYAAAVYRRYGPDQLVPERHSSEARRLSRAVQSLAREMNAAHRLKVAEHNGPGSRRAISNSQASFVTAGGAR